jgi:hypothetical protein
MGIKEEKEEKTFAEFAAEFVDQHAVVGPENGTVVVEVTREELMELGRCFVRIMVGWGAGLNRSRARRRGIVLPEWFTPVSIDANEEERPKLALVREIDALHLNRKAMIDRDS